MSAPYCIIVSKVSAIIKQEIVTLKRGVVVVLTRLGLALCHLCVCCFSTFLLQPVTDEKSQCIYFPNLFRTARNRSPSAPSVVTAAAATSVGTGSDCGGPCLLPPAADPLPPPAADYQPENSALERIFAQMSICRDCTDLSLRLLVLMR